MAKRKRFEPRSLEKMASDERVEIGLGMVLQYKHAFKFWRELSDYGKKGLVHPNLLGSTLEEQKDMEAQAAAEVRKLEKDLMDYRHPKKKAVEVTGEVDGPPVINIVKFGTEEKD